MRETREAIEAYCVAVGLVVYEWNDLHEKLAGLFALVRATPGTLRYENQVIVAEGDYVIAHGRFSGIGRPAAWIAADVVRFEDGLLAEHWDVLQDEATQAESVSGLPMFGKSFPS